MKKYNCIIPIMIFTAAITFSVNAVDPYKMQMDEIRKEIKELQAKTSEVREKIKQTEEKASKDSASYAEYLFENRKRVQLLSAEKDSLSGLVKKLDEKRTEIVASSEVIEMRKGNYKALVSSVLLNVVKSCKEMQDYLVKYKQFNIERQIDALGFLAVELTSGTVDVVEGVERYYQIIKQLEKYSEETEVWRGKAPGGLLKGEVSYLRLGMVWLGCINADNTKALIWDNKESKWFELDNSGQLLNIRMAVDLVSGSAAPQLVALPFSHDFVVIKTGDESNE